MTRLPRYATRFDFARVVQRDLMAGDNVSQVARRYGITRGGVYDLAYGSKQIKPPVKMMEALGYDSKLPHYTLKRRNGDAAKS